MIEHFIVAGLSILISSLFLSPAWQNDDLPPLLISEVYYDTPGEDGLEEWVEIVNRGQLPVDLAQIMLGDEETQGEGEGMLRFPQGSLIQPGQVIIVAQTSAGFAALFGRPSDYEVGDSEAQIPDMEPVGAWATGDFALSNDGDEVLLLTSEGQLIDALNYGDSGSIFSPSILDVFSGQSIERAPIDCDRDAAADWQPRNAPTPGETSEEGPCTEIVAVQSNGPPLAVGEIQGPGNVSPYINQNVTFRGVVIGAMADRNAAGIVYHTLFIQDLPQTADGDPATSDGIAVFLGQQAPAFSAGDIVEVSGDVTEFFGLTEIDDRDLRISLLEAGGPLPAAVSYHSVPELEALEGMLVAVDRPLTVVGPTHSGCGFEAAAADEPRPIRQQVSDELGQVIRVLSQSDVACAGLPALKSGDQIAGIIGPLTYHFDFHKIVQQDDLALEVTEGDTPALELPRALAGAEFSVATFNVLDLFDTKNDTGLDAEPAPTEAQLNDKVARLAAAVTQLLDCPTLLGIQEAENRAVLEQLAAAAAAACGFTYEITHIESLDARGIDVALLSDPTRVAVLDATTHQTCTTLSTGLVDPALSCRLGERALFSRPPLEASLLVDGQPVTVIVNHFKSKRGGESETAPRRREQAQLVADRVNEITAETPDAAVIVLGDFNDYELSPALVILTEEAGLTNSLQTIPEAQRYTYIFDGAAQLLDAILVSDSLAPRIQQATIVHSNADYPANFIVDVAAGETPRRSSDHDIPVIIIGPPTGSQQAAASEAGQEQVSGTPEPAATGTSPPAEVAVEELDAPAPAVRDQSAADQNSNQWWLYLLAGAIGSAAGVLIYRWRKG